MIKNIARQQPVAYPYSLNAANTARDQNTSQSASQRTYLIKRDSYRSPRAFLFLLCIALLPRMFTLDRPLTVDEAYFWQQRSAVFFNALISGRFADTIITGHPGVTTMWLGTFGLLLERALVLLGWLNIPTDQMHLALLRLPLACASALAVALGYLLFRRIVSDRTAMIAALLWASDPFLVAHSRLIHLDATLTMLMLLALLALLAACFNRSGARARPSARLTMLAGVISGFAVVTKAPAVLLAPIGGMVLLAWYGCRRVSTPQAFVHLLQALLLWGGVTVLTAFLTWPALWVAPQAAIQRVVNEVIMNGGTQHPHNFLLGSDDRDPGALFYPVTLLARTTPWCALGVLLLPLAAWRSRPWHVAGQLPLVLVLFAIALTMLVFTLEPKKFDRYFLPAIPWILMLSAAGWSWLLAHSGLWLRRGLSVLLVLGGSTTLWLLHPYYLAYYSPLIGARAQAPLIVPVGEGEGLDLAAAWLNTQPDIRNKLVATWSPPTIQPYLQAKATFWYTAERLQADYLVAYVYDVQTGSPYVRKLQSDCTPLHTVQLNGIDYAWIFRVPKQTEQTLDARFGQQLALNGATVAPPNTACGATNLTLTLNMHRLEVPQQPINMFIHIIGDHGQRVAQFDIPLETIAPAGEWRVDDVLEHTFALPLPTDLPAGGYQIMFGLYYTASGQRLPLVASTPVDPAVDGDQALPIINFEWIAFPHS